MELIIGSPDGFHCHHGALVLESDDCYLCVVETRNNITIDSQKYKRIGIEHVNGKDIITLEPW